MDTYLKMHTLVQNPYCKLFLIKVLGQEEKKVAAGHREQEHHIKLACVLLATENLDEWILTVAFSIHDKHNDATSTSSSEKN